MATRARPSEHAVGHYVQPDAAQLAEGLDRVVADSFGVMPGSLDGGRGSMTAKVTIHSLREQRGDLLLKDRLVGTWGLVSLETRRSDGTTSYLLGPSPRGRFMFDAEGNFTAQLMNPDRQDDNSGGYIANWGVYQVDEERQTFTLDFIGSAQLATIGLRTVRHVNFKDASVAVFSTDPHVVGGITEQTFITWEKLSPAAPA